MTMTPEQMMATVRDVPAGALLFVSYVAGRVPTERAVREARPHTENPSRSRRHFVGTLSSVRTSKNGDLILTIFAHNRNTEEKAGGFRSFNPNLGLLLSIEVLS